MIQFCRNKADEQEITVKGHKIIFTYAPSTRCNIEYSLRIVIDYVPVLDDNGEVLEIYEFPYTFKYDGIQIEIIVK